MPAITAALLADAQTARTAHGSPGPAGPAGRRPAPAHPGRGPAGRGTGTRTGGRSRAATPQDLAQAFARLYLEVECGRRPAAQLAPLMDPVLHARLEPVWVRLHQPLGVVRSVVALASGSRHLDAVVVVQRGQRAGALALRLTRRGEGWCVTEAVRPEDGPLPPAPFGPPPELDSPGESPQRHERYLALAGGPG